MTKGSDDALTALAQFAGQTVTAAAITDRWKVVLDRFTRLMGQGNPLKTEVVGRRLGRTHEQLSAAGFDVKQFQGAVAELWAERFADLLDENPGLEPQLRALVQEIADQLPTGVVSAAGYSVAAGQDLRITASGGGIAAGVFHGNVMLAVPAQDERLRSMQAETYVDMLRYQGGGMLEDPPEAATAEEWAIRGELLARAKALASLEVWDLWQKSALAHYALSDYVSEEWPQWRVGAYDVEDEMEVDLEFCRLRQVMKVISKQLTERIQIELGVSRQAAD